MVDPIQNLAMEPSAPPSAMRKYFSTLIPPYPWRDTVPTTISDSGVEILKIPNNVAASARRTQSTSVRDEH
jgi:hypothetical protein